MWKCVYDCGNIHIAREYNLLQGFPKSYRCLREQNYMPVGIKQGRLTILEHTKVLRKNRVK